MNFSEHLLFLALMIPTFVLLVVAAVLLAQPAHPSAIAKAQPVPMVQAARAHPVDERGYEGTY